MTYRTDFTTGGFVTPVSEAEQFFYDHAGYIWDPKTQTKDEGHQETARRLAAAERWARDERVEFLWEDDPDGEDADSDTEWADWPHYSCSASLAGKFVSSLGGVMFREREDPFDGDPYRRVVEAELALEAMS